MRTTWTFGKRWALAAAATAVASGAARARADSPLTSCDFHEAYADAPEVAHALASGLDDETMRALDDPAVGHDVRAAMVNALGWRAEGQAHARKYVRHLALAHEKPAAGLTLAELTVQEVFALGHLIAMDDYFELAALGGPGEVQQADALRLLDEAAARAPKDFAVAMVRALARAQRAMDGDWCDVYLVVREVEARFDGDPGLRAEAVRIIMEYVRLYRDSCPGGE